jgi:hypothetical protein
MLALTLFNLVTLVVALLIGVVTGRWMFAGRRPETPKDEKPGGPAGP